MSQRVEPRKQVEAAPRRTTKVEGGAAATTTKTLTNSKTNQISDKTNGSTVKLTELPKLTRVGTKLNTIPVKKAPIGKIETVKKRNFGGAADTLTVRNSKATQILGKRNDPAVIKTEIRKINGVSTKPANFPDDKTPRGKIESIRGHNLHGTAKTTTTLKISKDTNVVVDRNGPAEKSTEYRRLNDEMLVRNIMSEPVRWRSNREPAATAALIPETEAELENCLAKLIISRSTRRPRQNNMSEELRSFTHKLDPNSGPTNQKWKVYNARENCYNIVKLRGGQVSIINDEEG